MTTEEGTRRNGAAIGVLIVDDHRMFSEAIELLLAGQEGIYMVGSVSTGEEAVDVCQERRPNVVLVDIDLPGIDGVETTRRLKDQCPDVRIVIITAFQEPATIAAAISAGASGYVPKTHAADQLLDVVRAAASGELVLPETEVRSVLQQLETDRRDRGEDVRRLAELTSREIQVLQALAEGKSTNEISRALFISPHTVQSHVKNAMAKLGVHSKLEAVTSALRRGLIRI